MGSGRPTHGPMVAHPELDVPWWACHAENHSSSPIAAKRAPRHMTAFGAIYVRGDAQASPFITHTHRGLGVNLAPMAVNGSAMIAMGGYLTNVLVYGTVAVGDRMRLSTVFGVLRQEDVATATGHVMAFSMGTNTAATEYKRINVLVIPWRI